ncbi:hypothetical protein [Photobacterium leiognathi]|uniref:hypothetical protein n=1 Tax=Photobacterium leiognathi TaxID=553611 RepID=UPI002980CA90|nr:hypothetical protein [Photobacterium leiognathi]
MTNKKITVLFDNTENDQLPLYVEATWQEPQKAFITLDLRNGEVDADYQPIGDNGVPTSVHNGVVLRFSIVPENTGESISKIIAHFEDQLLSIYKKSQVKLNSSNNFVGCAAEGIDEEQLGDEILFLSRDIGCMSFDNRVDIGDEETLLDVIEVTPDTSNLEQYVAQVVKKMEANYFILEGSWTDSEVVTLRVLEKLSQHTDCLNKNGMIMLLDNIDSHVIDGFSRNDIEQDDIDAAMSRN